MGGLYLPCCPCSSLVCKKHFYSHCFIYTAKVSKFTSSYLETFSSFRSITSFPTMNTLNTLQATSLAMEVNVIKIIFDGQASLHPLCESHSSIYLFCEGFSMTHVDIQAHRQSPFGWGALHWIANAQLPTGYQWTEMIPTNAENRLEVGDIATLIHNKRLDENCIHNRKCDCRNWV